MNRQYNYLKNITIFLALLGIAGCEPSKEFTYYFNTKELRAKKINSADTLKKIKRPIAFPSSEDFQVKIADFNPLRTEIIIEDSSIEKPIGDTDALAALIVFPSIPKTGATATAVADSTVMSHGANFSFVSSQKNREDANARASRQNADCITINNYMHNLDQTITFIDNASIRYKELMDKIEIISDDEAFLSTLDVLKTTDVNERLKKSFIDRLNEILSASKKLNTDPSKVSSREISNLESEYFKEVIVNEKYIDNLIKEIEDLKGECSGFPTLLKKFLGSATKAKESIKDFKVSHVDKLLPALNKKLLVFDNLKKYLTNIPEYTSKAVNIDKDFHMLNIYSREKNNTEKKLYDRINIEPTNGFKINIAAGVFFSSLSDNSFSKKTLDSFYTKKYLANGIVRDTTIQQNYTAIYNKKQSSISYGGMLYVIAHSQNASWFNYGGYVGFGALFNDQTRWAGAVGGSLIIGKSQKFSINAGVVLAQVERITQPYRTDVWYAEAIDNIPTYKAWNIKPMLGFSWSLK